MSKTESFTTDRVNRFTCDKGKSQTFYRDSKTPCLGVRVTTNGAKSYIFETFFQGKALRITIGNTASWTLGQAKARATELKTTTDKGIDPRELDKEKAEAREVRKLEAKRKGKTVAQAWEAYISHLRTVTKKNGSSLSERHITDHINLASMGGEKSKRSKQKTKAGALAALMPLKMNDLDSDLIDKWLAKENATRKTQAALAFRLFKAFLRWCDEERDFKGLAHPAILEVKKVKNRVTSSGTKDDDYVRLTDLAAWFKGINQLSNQSVRTYLIGMLLTGARRNELLGLRWEDVNLPRHEAVLRDKVKGQRTIPLPPYLSSLIAQQPRITGNPWVFASNASNSKTGRIAAISDPHTAVLKSQGLPHSSLHGLRRSFITFANKFAPAGISHKITGQSAKNLQDKYYQRWEPHELLEWHTIIERKIIELAGIEFNDSQITKLKVIA